MTHILISVQILTFCLMCSGSDSESGRVRANVPVSWPEAASAGKLPPQLTRRLTTPPHKLQILLPSKPHACRASWDNLHKMS